MNNVQIMSYKRDLTTGLVHVELEMVIPTGNQKVTIPVSDDLLTVTAGARGESTWSEPDIAEIIVQFLLALSNNVTWQ